MEILKNKTIFKYAYFLMNCSWHLTSHCKQICSQHSMFWLLRDLFNMYKIIVNKPSLRVCKPAYSELVLKPRNRAGCYRNTDAVVCVGAAGLLVVMQ